MGHSSSVPPEAPKLEQVAARWSFRIDGVVREWDWSGGAPVPQHLGSVRKPRSTEWSRHVPVHSHSVTTGAPIHVESGLEHDLVLDLDRRNDVGWLVAQPCRIEFVSGLTGRRRRHVPDLLSLTKGGEVTLWDVRPEGRRDAKFDDAAQATEIASGRRGWHYEVFGGFELARTYNQRWLAAYRRTEPWHEPCRSAIILAATDPDAKIGTVIELDGGSGHLLSTMWHEMWSGSIEADLDRPLTRQTPLRWVESSEGGAT